ncbi:MAG: 4Fe-4S dicluster domain-containing protein [Hyphomicrobiales bacterium]
MSYATLKTNGNPRAALQSVLGDLLAAHRVDAVMVAARTPYSPLPMPTLFADPDQMAAIEPFAPVAPFNAARQAAAVLRYDAGRRVAVVLRPCEVRALIELAKLHQCALNHAVLIGIDCLGRMENGAYLEAVRGLPEGCTAVQPAADGLDQMTTACQACLQFQPQAVDLAVWLIGYDAAEAVGLSAATDTGRSILDGLQLEPGQEPAGRSAEAARMLEQRRRNRETLLKDTAAKTAAIEKFQAYFATCLNCYNCRVACPVCYCKECVFGTDIFAHPPEVLLRRAAKRGAVKLPTDTTMFHLTRMAHMSHACVGCGHCSSVCPSNIPVADVFIRVAAAAQALYRYEPGRDVNEPIPLLVFEEKEEEKAS